MLRSILAVLILILAIPWGATAFAGPFEDGAAAYKRRDYATALELWKPLAEQGNAYAQVYLGFMYDYGEGVPRNDAEAVKWYRLAAEQGNADAQANLGFMYAHGRGVAQNEAEAVKWYRLAAEQGNAAGQSNLGFMYFTRSGRRSGLRQRLSVVQSRGDPRHRGCARGSAILPARR